MTGARGALLLGATLLVALLFLAGPAAAQQPNLVVTDLAVEPSQPSGGDTTVFPATIENQGDGSSEPFTVRWILDGDQTLDEHQANALDPGESVTVRSRNWTAEPGDHSIRAIADVFNRNDETDETDNVLRTTFTVATSDEPRGPVAVLGTPLPTPREGATAVPHDDGILLVGGANGTGVDADDPDSILRFTPETEAVEAVGTPLPTPLRDAAAVAADRRVHVLGGRTPDGLTAAIRTYDTATGNVTTANATLPTPTCCGAALWNGTHVLLLGGATPDGPTDRIVAWRPGDNATTTLPATLPAPRTRLEVAWDGRDLPNVGCPGGCAYVLGGEGPAGDPVRTVTRYNPTGGEVETVSGSLPAGGAVDAAVAWSGRHAYVVGGEDPPDHLRRVVRYDPVIDVAETRYARLPTGRLGLAAAWHGEAAYVFGGRHDATLDEILRYEPGKPDLAVRDLTIRPAAPDVGDPVRFRATVENVGTVPAGNLTVRFRLDEAPLGSTDLDGLDVNRSLRVSSDRWNATAGPHAVKATVLLTSSSGELRQDNNEANGAFTVNQPPVPAFNATVDGLNVTVNASATVDPDGAVATYTWFWGDGTRSTGGPTATHAYDASGNFTIILEVEDTDGATSQTSRTVTPNRPPVAAFEATVAGQTVEVDATPSTDPDGNPVVSYLWSWGDNSTLGSGLRTNHTYSEIGIYTVTLNVRDALGADATTRKEIEVWGPIPGPGLVPALAAALAALAVARRRR